MAKSDWNLNDSVMPEDMNQIGQEINDMAESLDNHINATLVHGATDAATPNRIARRDANGQFEVGAPTAANHVARKVDLDEVKQSVSDGKNQIASAITGMGQTASGSDTFAQLSGKIRDISKDANAAVGDVLTGKTFYQGGVKRTGTMANRAGSTVAPMTKTGYNGAVDFKIPAGYYDSNSIINGQDANFTTGNIKAGVTVFGMTGVFTDDANAAAADILSGKTAYVKGSKVTGSMPVATDRSAPANMSADTDGRFMVAPAKGYWDGGKWVKTSLIDRAAQTQAVSFGRSGTSIYFRLPQGVYRTNAGPGYPEVYYEEPNLVAANIVSGKSIFGVSGSAIVGRRYASGSTTPQNVSSGMHKISVRGLAFTPNLVCVVSYIPGGVNQGYYGSMIARNGNPIGTSGAFQNYFPQSNESDDHYEVWTSTGSGPLNFQIVSGGFDMLVLDVPSSSSLFYPSTSHWVAFE